MTLIPGTNCFTKVQDSAVSLLLAVDEIVAFLASPSRPAVVLPRNQTECAKYIHVNAYQKPADNEEYTQDELDVLFPTIIVHTEPEEGTLHVKDSSNGWGAKQGTLVMVFVRLWNEDLADPELAVRKMENLVGDVIEAMLDVEADYLDLLQVQISPAFIGKIDEDISDDGEEIIQQVTLEWGVAEF